MKRLLAIVNRIEDGFRGYVPRLPGCEIHAPTAEQAEADLSAAARSHLAAGKEGTNGFDPVRVEIVVLVEAPPPPRPRGDGLDELYDQARRDFNVEELEMLVNWEEHEWVEMDEDFFQELEGTAEQPRDETKE